MIAFSLGVLSWSLAEYVIHRFDGHQMRGKTPFSKEHLAHHRDPRYFAAWWKKGAAALIVMALFYPFFGLPFTVGFTLMYLTYELIHRRIHTHAPFGFYGTWARRHHLLHHHQDPEMNYGVTSPVWDWVFGTLVTAEVVEVPRRRAPDWLVSETSGRFHSMFQLRG